EEITTIFVVGFPDDMLEREFQNMFTFSAGFEAATLKIPSQTDSDDGTGMPNARKQIIGFAKFRTRLDALEARDVLSGRKVDAERGCVLKAEMAKKNLHTKRGLSNEHQVLAAAGFGINQFGHLQRRGSKDSASMFTDPFFMPGTTPPVSRHFNDMLDLDRSAPAPMIRSQSFSEQRGFSSALFSSESLLPRLSPPMSLGVATSSANSHSSGSAPSSASNSAGASPTGLAPFGPRSNSDHNPPCNTLYVGNLPPDTSEDELRELFSRCPGYKRLCFRGRPNGPMCFVEFDDVQCATQALFQLYGNPLSNSTKGGIRLSYSKNPLGVRASLPASAASVTLMATACIPMDKEPKLIHGC
ncbi:uncharacterized protein EV422DRAFT_495144, partial [Fimicolochytrium jonesii]|uniref:uncharacterized protein n=1 Tax=Fimicolochytrium jonesii TaxID=1396493 RepID=UPI0022FDB2F2